jgi:hypothetical protein
MRPEGSQELRDALQEAVIDDALVLERLDFMFPLLTFLVNLVLLGSDEGSLVDVGVDLNVGVIAELQGVLESSQPH